MPPLFRTSLATYLGDLLAVAGLALLTRDVWAGVGAELPNPSVVADLALVVAGLLAHRVALARGREASTLALGFLLVGSLSAVAITDRWWLGAAAAAAAAALAPHFVVPRRAAVWVAAGVLLTVPGALSSPAAGAAAAVFVLGVGWASSRLAAHLRGTAARTVLELEQALEAERLRDAELVERVGEHEGRERRHARRSLVRVALTRRLGAIEAIARSIARDLREARPVSADASLDAALRRGVHRAEQLARLAAGGAARERQTTLALVWPRVVHLVGARFEPGHHLVVTLPGDLPPVVGGGEEWAQMLGALVENAIEAMPGGGVLKVGAEASGRAGFARVVVEDAGCGIAPEVLPHVTEPFYTSRAERGADGLGLAMVASVVEGLTGSLHLESAVGVGTEVTIEVPFAPGPEPGGEPEPMRLEGTVLLADDDRETRRALARILESFGLLVVEADGGAAARAQLSVRLDEFRAAVLDVVMPGTPVGEVVAEARERRPGLPVLLISGYDTMQMVDGVLALGGVRFLRKPIGREEFFAALRDLFSVEEAGRR
jgi:signal transduction histidine kinase/CheY-like chemotaxis protein